METDNHTTYGDFEHVVRTDEMDNGVDQQLNYANLSTDNSNIVVMLRNEVSALKTENKVLLATNREMQVRLEAVEQKLKVVESGKKQQMRNIAAEKANETTDQVGGKLCTTTEPLWTNNRLHICSGQENHVLLSAGGLVATSLIAGKNSISVYVRAEQPVSRTILSSITDFPVLYFEVYVTANSELFRFGWVGPDASLMKNKWIGDCPGSYGIDSTGAYEDFGHDVEDYGKGIDEGDVVGSGLLLTRYGKLKLFFTKNGRLNGKPIILKESERDNAMLLFPAISFYYMDSTVETNFGKMPFMFDVDAHVAKLFN